MLRAIGIVAGVGAGLAAWLTLGDRRSVAALTVVEWESTLGVPVHYLLAGVALLLLFIAPRKPRSGRGHQGPSQRAQQGLRTRVPGTRPTASDGHWLSEVRSAAAAIQFEAGASLTIDLNRVFPVVLELRRMPVEKTRRAVAHLSEWLLVVPHPPRVKIVFIDCPEASVPRHHQVAGVIAGRVERNSFHVVSQEESVEIVFHNPGEAWPAVQVVPNFQG